MKERLVKGSNLVDVVRMLRAHPRDRGLPELGHWEQDLLRKRVSASTWYSLQVFDSLLQTTHRYLFDGSEAAAQRMGRTFAQKALESGAGQFVVVESDPEQTLAQAFARWRELYNFGEVTVATHTDADARRGVRVRITAYPDMSATHGHTIMGFSQELAERAGAKALGLRVEERPWMHNSALTYTLNWS
jgi:uncharacterized protein (TIGR02265 family)